jgi:hypothetical protein
MRRRTAYSGGVAIVWLALLPAAARGQAAWEYTQYEVRTWLALQSAPQLPAMLVSTIGDAVDERASTVCGAVMQMQVAAAPAAARGAMLYDLDNLTPEEIAAAADRQELEGDKIFLAAIFCRNGAFVVRVRELDCRSRQLGSVFERSCAAAGELPLALWDAVVESFTPLARIEQVEQKKVVARLRAGGLITSPDSPAVVEPGMVLRPIIRRNDRSGLPAKGGVQAVEWTFLAVAERRDAVLECTLQSGYRTPIPTRGGVRLERLALAVRPRYEATKLELRSRTGPAKPLVGYEIHVREEDKNETKLLGVTDEQGTFNVPRGDEPLETLVIKSGKQLLARLPIVPGQAKTMTAKIVDDDGRLAAEGLIAALSSRALDLVARREILAARIRARVKEGKIDEAQRLLDDFRRLETRNELSRDLDRYRQQATSSDKVTQGRIDKLFTEAQKLLLLKPLSDELLAQLTRELSAARASGG